MCIATVNGIFKNIKVLLINIVLFLLVEHISVEQDIIQVVQHIIQEFIIGDLLLIIVIRGQVFILKMGVIRKLPVTKH